MLLIDIIFCAEALDGISIVYNSVRKIIQVFKTFSRPSHLVSCPLISFDRHAWNVQDCLGLAQVAEFSPFLGRPIYCKNTKKRDWNFLLLTTYRHQTEFHKELSTNIEWSSTNDSIFLKYAAPELKKNNSSGAHLLYSWCILKDLTAYIPGIFLHPFLFLLFVRPEGHLFDFLFWKILKP